MKHAAWPQDSVDPVIMAAEAVIELQTIRARNLAPSDPAVLSVTMLHTGVRTNIIPDQATLGGTSRTFDDKVEARIEARLDEIVESIARGAGGSAEVRFYDRVPVSVSDPALVKRMLPAVERAVGKSNVTLSPPACWPTISRTSARQRQRFSSLWAHKNRERHPGLTTPRVFSRTSCPLPWECGR